MVPSDSARAAIEAMGFTFEEALTADGAARAAAPCNPRDQRICLCGHAMARHSSVGGRAKCRPSHMQCLCTCARAVIAVSDLRTFLQKTTGGSREHALMRGVAALYAKGKRDRATYGEKSKEAEIKWLITRACDKCKTVDNNVVPVPVTQAGLIAEEATGYDALLCRKCRGMA